MKKQKPELTPEQAELVQAYKYRFGRIWKAQMRRDWHHFTGAVLRQMRNDFADRLHLL